jgi:hypothetical protein
MAQTKRKRRRKRRGTQGGRIDSRSRGRPANRAEARQRAQSRRGRTAAKGRPQRGAGPKPPTWGSAVLKGVMAAALFFGLTAFVFKQSVGAAASLAGFMLVFYIPMGYYVDRFMYQRHLRKLEEARVEKAQQRGSGGG